MYVPSTRKIISSYDVVFDESFSSMLAYKSQPYSEVMAMRPDVSYIPCDTSLRGKTDDIITFTNFEEANLLSESSNDAGSGDKYDDKSIITPLITK